MFTNKHNVNTNAIIFKLTSDNFLYFHIKHVINI